MKILVCGGRDFRDDVYVDEVLHHYLDIVTMIIHGGARGADTLAGYWAGDHDIPCLRVPAKWQKGKAAGYIRNKQMLTYGPDLVIAFPGGRGTANMVQLAKESGLKCLDLRSESGDDESQGDWRNLIDRKV